MCLKVSISEGLSGEPFFDRFPGVDIPLEYRSAITMQHWQGLADGLSREFKTVQAIKGVCEGRMEKTDCARGEIA